MQHLAMQQIDLTTSQKSVEQLPEERAGIRKVERNRFMARRRIYEDAGWPNLFDREDFRRRTNEWHQRSADLINPYIDGPRAAYWMQHDHDQPVGDMFRENAGPYSL